MVDKNISSSIDIFNAFKNNNPGQGINLVLDKMATDNSVDYLIFGSFIWNYNKTIGTCLYIIYIVTFFSNIKRIIRLENIDGNCKNNIDVREGTSSIIIVTLSISFIMVIFATVLASSTKLSKHLLSGGAIKFVLLLIFKKMILTFFHTLAVKGLVNSQCSDNYVCSYSEDNNITGNINVNDITGLPDSDGIPLSEYCSNNKNNSNSNCIEYLNNKCRNYKLQNSSELKGIGNPYIFSKYYNYEIIILTLICVLYYYNISMTLVKFKKNLSETRIYNFVKDSMSHSQKLRYYFEWLKLEDFNSSKPVDSSNLVPMGNNLGRDVNNSSFWKIFGILPKILLNTYVIRIILAVSYLLLVYGSNNFLLQNMGCQSLTLLQTIIASSPILILCTRYLPNITYAKLDEISRSPWEHLQILAKCANFTKKIKKGNNDDKVVIPDEGKNDDDCDDDDILDKVFRFFTKLYLGFPFSWMLDKKYFGAGKWYHIITKFIMVCIPLISTNLAWFFTNKKKSKALLNTFIGLFTLASLVSFMIPVFMVNMIQSTIASISRTIHMSFFTYNIKIYPVLNIIFSIIFFIVFHIIIRQFIVSANCYKTTACMGYNWKDNTAPEEISLKSTIKTTNETDDEKKIRKQNKKNNQILKQQFSSFSENLNTNTLECNTIDTIDKKYNKHELKNITLTKYSTIIKTSLSILALFCLLKIIYIIYYAKKTEWKHLLFPLWSSETDNIYENIISKLRTLNILHNTALTSLKLDINTTKIKKLMKTINKKIANTCLLKTNVCDMKTIDQLYNDYVKDTDILNLVKSQASSTNVANSVAVV